MTGAMARELGSAFAERQREPCVCDWRYVQADCEVCRMYDLAHAEKECKVISKRVSSKRALAA
jgi:hypothetical protein